MATASPTKRSASLTKGVASATSGLTPSELASIPLGTTFATSCMPVLNTPGLVPKRADTAGTPSTSCAECTCRETKSP
eukprot:1136012-Prorocentrum_minimum.AAC.1